MTRDVACGGDSWSVAARLVATVTWHCEELLTMLGSRGATRVRLHRLPPPLHLVPSMLKARDVCLLAKLSNARAVWLAMKLRDETDLMQLDDIPAIDLLRSPQGSPRFIDWFWRSAAMSLMNVPLEYCSSAALMRAVALPTHPLP